MTRHAPSRLERILLLTVWGISALYAVRTLDRGWIPHDEGTLAQSAERVLQGELPHRDFDELYTGGLSVMNAAAFKVLGVNLLTPRLLLFAFFLAWVPTLFFVLTRFASPPLAALGSLLAVSWSIPNYPAAMPSWYNLFFAVFGLAALLRYVETPRRRWLFAAGLAGGMSVTVKTSGLFFVAAGLLFLAYREQTQSETPEGSEAPAGPREDRAYSLLSTFMLATFVVLLVLLVGTRPGAAGVLRFIVPLAGIALFLVWSEWWTPHAGRAARRLTILLGMGVPFAAGVLVPITTLVLVYLSDGALHDLIRGLFGTPMRRIAFASTPPPGLETLWVALPFVALVGMDTLPRPRLRTGVAIGILAAGLGTVFLPSSTVLLPSLWYLLNALAPLVAVAGLAWLVRAQRAGGEPLRRQRVLGAFAVAGGVVLIQFPFSGAIYVFYALPALVPAALALRHPASLRTRPVLPALVTVLLLFSVRWINTGDLFSLGHFGYDPSTATQRLALPRGGGLRVSPHDKDQYERLVVALRELSTSPYTFATPDLPEVYFLSGLRNPTPTLFDFFDETQGRTARILESLDAHGVSVVVLNRALRFSGPPPDDLLAGLRARYPDATIIGDFVIRWRSSASGS